MAKDVSIFVDESGDKTDHTRYFILTLVIHDQRVLITDEVSAYESSLSAAGLPNIPFHSEPLLNGHKEYQILSLKQRKKLLSLFARLVRFLPIKYKSFVYTHEDFSDTDVLKNKIIRDISGLFCDQLNFFQSFENVKVYYDNGQALVRNALDTSVSSTLSKQAIVRRRSTMTEYRLAQVADYLCCMELAALKYENKENGETYNKFFGGIGSFKKNWLKQVRRKHIK